MIIKGGLTISDKVTRIISTYIGSNFDRFYCGMVLQMFAHSFLESVADTVVQSMQASEQVFFTYCVIYLDCNFDIISRTAESKIQPQVPFNAFLAAILKKRPHIEMFYPI